MQMRVLLAAAAKLLLPLLQELRRRPLVGRLLARLLRRRPRELSPRCRGCRRLLRRRPREHSMRCRRCRRLLRRRPREHWRSRRPRLRRDLHQLMPRRDRRRLRWRLQLHHVRPCADGILSQPGETRHNKLDTPTVENREATPPLTCTVKVQRSKT
jgi:hypothetical protein